MKELKEIPTHWCVRRTPENAEVLNAWAAYKRCLELAPTLKKGFLTYESYTFDIPSAPCNLTEITFEQWQTIPEVKEWLKENYPECGICLKRVKFMDAHICTPTPLSSGVYTEFKPENFYIKVEEREIIGYEAPRDLFGKRIKAGSIFTKCAITTVSFEYIHGQTILPAEIVETWKPVYAAKHVLKVGDWVTNALGRTYQFDSNTSLMNYEVRFATTEEIEAARPKRKYMKQVFIVSYRDAENYKAIANIPCDSKEEANKWILENSVQGGLYEVKTFEVVAYE